MSNETVEQPRRTNTSLWILVGSFIIPIILAYAYFFLGDRPAVKSNGNLIIPIVDIHTLNITDKSGSALTEEQLTPHWQMVYFVGSSCDADCQNSLISMRQINIGMGKYQDRVNHAIVHLEEADDALVQLINKEHQAAGKIYTKAENITALSQLENDASHMQSIYLVDPLGNIMMYFPKGLEPKLIRKDINKLLKVSRLR